MPKVGLELKTLRSRVICSTHWASQVPLFCFVLFWNIYLFLRDRKSISRGRAKREGDRVSKTGSVLSVQSPILARTQEPWEHDLSWSWLLNWLSHPGAPVFCFFFKCCACYTSANILLARVSHIVNSNGRELHVLPVVEGHCQITWQRAWIQGEVKKWCP